MNTKYGELSPALANMYKSLLINRIFKTLPLKEEEISTINDHIDSLNSELFGFSVLCNNDIDAATLISVVNLLEHVRIEAEHKKYRREILKCCNLVSKVGDGDV